ncbi:MAG: methyltransferase domain-containing protein [Bacteroidia bacterium]|nr:methyltransferase domain-containing protein [Bacteroidia bacterium]
MTPADVQARLSPYAVTDEMREYIRVHAQRFAYLIDLVSRLRAQFKDSSIRIMDVGPSFFTQLLMEKFPQDEVWSLGFKHDTAMGGHLSPAIANALKNFITFDLNDSYFLEKWVQPPPCDIVIAAEVIEHLYTSPIQVYRFFRSFMKPNAYLIITTPNAVTLRNRLLMLLGKNPFEMIRETRDNPGHYREYTGTELRLLGEKAGLAVEAILHANYFAKFTLQGKIVDWLTQYALPATFRTGLTAIYRRKE